MASKFYITFTPCYTNNHHRLLQPPNRFSFPSEGKGKRPNLGITRVSDGGESYLGMWRKAMERERKEIEFNKIAETVAGDEGNGSTDEDLETKSSEFYKILEVPAEERDRVQRIQVIDRAAAAIAVATTLLRDEKMPIENESNGLGDLDDEDDREAEAAAIFGDSQQDIISFPIIIFFIFVCTSGSSSIGTPGPNFWSWIPPSNTNEGSTPASSRKTSTSPTQSSPVMELEPSSTQLILPFESKTKNPPLPPFQSLKEVEKQDLASPILETPQLIEEQEVDNLFSRNAENAAHAVADVDPVTDGTNLEGSMWWKETGTDVRPDGKVCRWTLTRGVSADKSVEWEEKYWEASDEFGYKELGSEKSGRDAFGNVWREFWKESLAQIEGSVHIEKTADKWGKNGNGGEWQEKWFEHYGAGQAEKWAHKWCTIDPTTQLEAGHAHVWHERWGEKYDGQGGSVKYTDKWAERAEGDGWTKWGDKWDEHFDQNGQGVKQGETWWEGQYGERWNKTWGEGHNGSGWVHKYGQSSSGEHWDTHVQQDTWYERYPHYGFYHCFENSVPLGQVKPSERKPE